MNLVNDRKEFFNVTLTEIERAVTELHGEVELTLAAEAAEFRQSVAIRSGQGDRGRRAGWCRGVLRRRWPPRRIWLDGQG